MRVSISATTFDIIGHVDIDALPGELDGSTDRRVNRVATLDGGVSVTDGGYSEGDRDLTYTWETVSQAHNDSIDRLVRLYTRVHVSTPRGVYLAAPASFTPGQEESQLALLAIDNITTEG